MSKGYPQVGDLVLNYENELCVISGFGKLRYFNNNYSVRVILNGDATYGGPSIVWNVAYVGLVNHSHLTLNNKGVWEVSAKVGKDPVFIEWLKHNSWVDLSQT